MTDRDQTPDDADAAAAAAAAARQARVEALRARRAAGATAPTPAPAATTGPSATGGRPRSDRSRPRRRHVAKGARIAAAGASLTGLFGLVAAMGAAEPPPSSSPATPSPVAAAAQPPVDLPALTVADDGRLVVQPPQALTAAPQVVSVTPDPGQTVVRTNGSR